MTEVDNWRELGQQLRVDSIRAANVTKSGHPTSSMSAADLMAVLMSKYLHYDFDNPGNPNNDHLIFSKGHASPLLYSMYKAAGAITDDELLTFRVFGSRWKAIPTPEIPWVDVATGSLGQGLPISVGVALSGKYLDKLPYRVWCLCGDSEMAEGSMWEAFEHAAFYELENLTAIIDVNRLGQRGETMHGWDLNSYAKRAEAFGWKAIEIEGHDLEEIDRAYQEALHTHGQPTVIVAHTLKGKGVKEVENQLNWHGKALDHPDEAIEELGGIRNIVVDVPKPEAAEPTHVRGQGRGAADVRGGRQGRRNAHGIRRSAARPRGHARRRRRRGRRGLELDLRRVLPRRAPRPLLRDVHREAADGRGRRRLAGAQAGTRSRRPSRRSSRAPTTSSAWPPSRARTSACADRTPVSRSARTGRCRWRSRISRSFAPSIRAPSSTRPTRTRPRSSWRRWPTCRASSTCAPPVAPRR